jgi:hypothetical protein
MIQSFADAASERFFETGRSRRLPPEILRRATIASSGVECGDEA